jgi:lipoyl(octanoyl) transferase
MVEHPPVYTQGQAGKPEHILNPGAIPIVQTDRGGQVTYHGPGQLVVYFMLDLKRLGLGVRDLVCHIEQALIDMLADVGILAERKASAPGVYVDGAKIASLGLRVRKGCTYHGLALNVNMDLTPFTHINPCGYEGLQMTQMAEHCALNTVQDAKTVLVPYLLKQLGYNDPHLVDEEDHERTCTLR